MPLLPMTRDPFHLLVHQGAAHTATPLLHLPWQHLLCAWWSGQWYQNDSPGRTEPRPSAGVGTQQPALSSSFLPVRLPSLLSDSTQQQQLLRVSSASENPTVPWSASQPLDSQGLGQEDSSCLIFADPGRLKRTSTATASPDSLKKLASGQLPR